MFDLVMKMAIYLLNRIYDYDHRYFGLVEDATRVAGSHRQDRRTKRFVRYRIFYNNKRFDSTEFTFIALYSSSPLRRKCDVTGGFGSLNGTQILQ